MSVSPLSHVVAAGCGGFIGAALRYIVSGAVHSRLGSAVFPWGTLVVNLIGCLFLGFVAGLIESRQPFGPAFRVFVTIGILGGFTTYSTFAFESFALAFQGAWMRAGASIMGHIVLGIAGAALGFLIGKGV